ncbi:DUF3231 family protein [Paenibacillus mucilaginosus]|nr:DUF3231 family protein [Paenibacillus mucilaginosus]MCG7218122.1 DUF3231 family protein [Paenibacillus mucilaginosus]WDM26124.1 DUF3231 family protein [Paenibacillus mucilaginosus]
MGILSGNPKHEPMHYGEIHQVWQFSMAAKGCISATELYRNHAGDRTLKTILGDILDQARLESKECDELLMHNGIMPAPALPARPEVELESIPAGARFGDPEIAAMIAADQSMGLVACSQVMGMSIREDIGALFAKYHATKAAISTRILRMNKEKGWLIPPPLQVKSEDLVKV